MMEITIVMEMTIVLFEVKTWNHKFEGRLFEDGCSKRCGHFVRLLLCWGDTGRCQAGIRSCPVHFCELCMLVI